MAQIKSPLRLDVKEIATAICEKREQNTWNQASHCYLIASLAKRNGMPEANLKAFLDVLAHKGIGGNASQFAQSLADEGVIAKQASKASTLADEFIV